MADSIKIKIELADAVANKVLGELDKKGQKAEKSLKNLGSTGSGAFKDINVGIGKALNSFDVFTANLAANAVSAAFGTMKNAAGALFNTFIVEGIEAAQKQEDALNNLNTQLALSGNYSAEASQDMQRFAAEMQRTTKVGDETTLGLLSLAATFGKTNEETKQLVQAAIELSAATGISLEGAVKNLGKTYSGLTGELGESLPIIKELSKEQLKAGEGIKLILDRFGGSASGQIATFSGAVAQAGNSFGDLQEVIGEVITQNPAVINAINAVSQVLMGSTDSVNQGKDAFKILVAEGLVGFIDAMAVTTVTVNAMAQTLVMAFNAIKIGILGAVAGAIAPLTYFSDTAKILFETLSDSIGDTAQEMAEGFGDGPLGDVAVKLMEVGNAAEQGLGKLKSGSDTATSGIKNVTDAMSKLSEEELRVRQENTGFAEGLAKESAALKSNFDERLSVIQAFYDEQTAIRESDRQANLDPTYYEEKLTQEQLYYEQRAALLEEQRLADEARVMNSNAGEVTRSQALQTIEKNHQAAMIKLKADYVKKESDIQKQRDQNEIRQRDSTLNTIASMASSSNQTLAAIGKAAGLTQIAIKTPETVADAYAWGTKFGGPVLGASLAAVASVAMAAQAAQLAGVKFEDGGIVPGSSFSGDRVQARVNSGEMILNRQQQAELFDIANGQGGSGGLREEIAALRETVAGILSQPLTIQIDGRELINITRSQLASGRSF